MILIPKKNQGVTTIAAAVGFPPDEVADAHGPSSTQKQPTPLPLEPTSSLEPTTPSFSACCTLACQSLRSCQ